MPLALSETTDIRPKFARYIGKALFAWYAMHALGAGEKCCWVPEVIYLGSGSEEKALSIWIAGMFLNLGLQ